MRILKRHFVESYRNSNSISINIKMESFLRSWKFVKILIISKGPFDSLLYTRMKDNHDYLGSQCGVFVSYVSQN